VFSDHVPGAVLLTDVWLMLDQLFGGKLLCKPGESKRTQAATEAGRCKKLMGELRRAAPLREEDVEEAAHGLCAKMLALIRELLSLLLILPGDLMRQLLILPVMMRQLLILPVMMRQPDEAASDPPTPDEAASDPPTPDEAASDPPSDNEVDDERTLILGEGQDVAVVADLEKEASPDAASDCDSGAADSEDEDLDGEPVDGDGASSSEEEEDGEAMSDESSPAGPAVEPMGAPASSASGAVVPSEECGRNEADCMRWGMGKNCTLLNCP
ncbi:unnamed protein product, partial [Durusdinium trenchii]